MNAPDLGSLLINKSGKFYYLCTYQNVWDPDKKRSFRKKGSTKTIGKILGGSKVGPIEWKESFIALYPELKGLDAKRNEQGKIVFTLKDDPELDDDQPKITVREAMRLKKLQAGATWLLDGIIADTPLVKALERTFSKYKNHLKILSLAYFLILEQRNSMTLYELFARKTRLPYSRPLSKSAITRIFQSITPHHIDAFLSTLSSLSAQRDEALNDFATKFWALDSTSFSTYSEHLSKAFYGKNKDGDDLKQLNMLMVVNQKSGEPYFYQMYSGNIPDVFTVKNFLQDSCRMQLGRDVVFVADKGYGCIKNINRFLQTETSFLLNVSTSLSVCKNLFRENRNALKNPINFSSAACGNHCYTVEINWSYPVNYQTDCKRPPHEKARLFVHIYYNPFIRMRAEEILKTNIERTLNAIYSDKELCKEYQEFKDTYLCFNTEKNEYEINLTAYHKELELKGVRFLVSDSVKNPIEAYRAYYDRIEVEKAFNHYKDTLGFNRLRSSDDYSLEGRVFVQFIATSIAIMLRKKIAKIADKGFRAAYDSDQKLLKTLSSIEVTQYEHGSYFSPIVKNLAEIYNKLGVVPPEDAPKTNSDKSIDEEDAEIMPELMEGYAEPDDDIDVLIR